ncbi:MAG: glycoside hydrolase family 3 protein [Ilumatobacteraceae bacterium]
MDASTASGGQGQGLADALAAQLVVDEMVLLTAGADAWHTAAIERLGVPSMRVTDGPVGARGTRFDGERSINVPCSTLLAATWDPAAVEAVGAVLGRETRAKGAHVLLAPTVNLHRTPVGGRNFECMSEDAFLTARMAVAYVRGVQGEGVGCCIKHFVGNDTEFERMTIDSRIDERTLRELYLRPFEDAVREAGVLAVMSAYNRVNGTYAADNALIADVLRGEWGFEGTVISDWFGLHSTAEGIRAGLDLEMPGPTLHRGTLLHDAISSGEVTVDEVRARARAVLWLLEATGALHGNGPGPEGSRDDPADEGLVRRVAAEGMVLLRNRPLADGRTVLPVDAPALAARGVRRIAVIGPNAAVGQVRGGGSAHVSPTRVLHPLDALQRRFAALGIDVVHAQGCRTHRRLPELDLRLCSQLTVDAFDAPEDLDDPAAVPVRTRHPRSSRITWFRSPTGRDGGNPSFGARVRTEFTPDAGGMWTFGLESVAPTRLLVDGRVLIDTADAPAGGSFFGTGKAEVTATIELAAGRTYTLAVEARHHATGRAIAGVNIGALAPEHGDPVDDAVALAGSADLSIVVVGTNDDWESEGWDRADIDLPGRQDELVRRVAEASAATVVVVNAGSPVSMPWLDEVDAVLMAWFPGQGLGDALADVLTGDVEPQGRLPVTFPRRLEDTPAFEHHPGRNGMAHYLEGRLVGHHWYSTVGREPLFPFGYGLGYSCVSIDDVMAPDAHTVTATVSNAGTRDAVEVVQVYAHAVDRAGLDGDEPEQRLVGFAKVRVPAGTSQQVRIELDRHAYRAWDTGSRSWTVRAVPHELRVGRSSADVVARVMVHPEGAR